MADYIEHYIAGRNAWKLGLLGFFRRLRGIYLMVILTIITMGTPFWWPKSFQSSYEVQLKYAFLFLLVTFSGSLLGIFIYVRGRAERSLDIKHYLHELAHFLRDHQTKAYKKLLSKDSKSTESDYENEQLRSYSNQVCERVKDYFSRLIKDSTVEVVIRLAKEASDDNKSQKVVYATVGRSSGLSSKREETSENISANEGIPRFFIEEKGSQGILVYNDLRKASEKGAYKWTSNDTKYLDEIKTMMVAPLNAWDGNRESMIGILYVTSRESNAFSIIYVDSMRFIADIIAQAFAHFICQRKHINKL